MADAYTEQTRWTKLRLSAVLDLVEPHPGERVLDLGCTAGAVTHFLTTHGSETVGVDLEPLAISRGRELFPELELHVADVADLPFENETFDKAVAADLVEHLDERTLERMLAEAYRVLRPGGTLSLYTPNPKHWVERAKARDFVLAQKRNEAPAVRDLRRRPSTRRLRRRPGRVAADLHSASGPGGESCRSRDDLVPLPHLHARAKARRVALIAWRSWRAHGSSA
jgi:SAM-dependent methyltransferase